jgi:hypothetical protein
MIKIWVTAFAQVSLKNSVIVIKDGGSNEITVKVGEGNLTYSEKKNREYKLDRGNLAGGTIRDGDDVPLELKIDATWEYISGAVGSDECTIEDALKQRGGASAWESTDDDICQPYAVDIEVTYTPDCGSADAEVLTFPDFRWESIDHDLKAGTFSISGKCNCTEPTSSRDTGTGTGT